MPIVCSLLALPSDVLALALKAAALALALRVNVFALTLADVVKLRYINNNI